ncbi:MAG: glutamate--tRNA ligase [Candidatus Magasanikbacteria bacterium]|nr:glutamate--tRNA ligase [Candidatus Magasanikbacteria bacterium]
MFMIKTRFAPSPTGYLHVGGLRTALYSYLFAKKHGGKFLLRIEDTDRERYVADGVANILKSLYWASVVPDEGVILSEAKDPSRSDKRDSSAKPQNDNLRITQKGENGPYTQSERLDIYKEYAQKLLDAGHAYYCFCSSERLEKLRADQQAKKMPTGYDGLCAKLDPTESKQKAEAGEKHVMRLKMDKHGETVFNDLIRGEVRFKNELVDDQVLIKSDGFPTYHFAVVVDDHLMGITHIIRGEEWISSVPKHAQLYKYFGWEIPEMAHLPLLLNPDKSKLSKRQGDVAVEDYMKKGYLPEALVNFVAFLGWNPGTEKEMYTMEELVKDFDLAKVGKTGGVFNIEKLDWYNKQYIKNLSNAELVEKAMPWLEEAGVGGRPILEKAVSLERERITILSELPEAIKFVFELPDYKADTLVWKKSSNEEVKNILPKLIEFFDTVDENDWDKQVLEEKTKIWIAEKGFSVGSVLWPMRVALSGQENSPGPFEIAEVLAKKQTITRLQIALEKL